jgi:hypothetical protein
VARQVLAVCMLGKCLPLSHTSSPLFFFFLISGLNSFLFFVILRLEHRAYTLSHSISPIFVKVFLR